jgi:hypothetical protein
MVNGSLQYESEEMVMSYYFQKTCVAPTFFDINGTQIQRIENLYIIIFNR